MLCRGVFGWMCIADDSGFGMPQSWLASCGTRYVDAVSGVQQERAAMRYNTIHPERADAGMWAQRDKDNSITTAQGRDCRQPSIEDTANPPSLVFWALGV